jgi:polyisoprenoid-binding protein YceI
MHKPIAAALASLALAAPALAADSYTIDPRHTWPVFEINHLGFSTQRGRFNETSGKITLDMAAKTGSVDIKIMTGTIDMGLDEWDKHLRSPDFFHVERYPTMTFRSDKLVFDGDKVVGAEGSLTLLGVTKPVKLAVANFRCGLQPVAKRELCAADVSTAIKRSDFGMSKFLPGVGDDVKIVIPVEAFKD